MTSVLSILPLHIPQKNSIKNYTISNYRRQTQGKKVKETNSLLEPIAHLSVLLIVLPTCPGHFSFKSDSLTFHSFVHCYTKLFNIFTFFPKTQTKNNVEEKRRYHLKHVWAFVKIYHSKKNLVGKCTGIPPGVRQNLVFLVSLPGKHTKWDAVSWACPQQLCPPTHPWMHPTPTPLNFLLNPRKLSVNDII